MSRQKKESGLVKTSCEVLLEKFQAEFHAGKVFTYCNTQLTVKAVHSEWRGVPGYPWLDIWIVATYKDHDGRLVDYTFDKREARGLLNLTK